MSSSASQNIRKTRIPSSKMVLPRTGASGDFDRHRRVCNLVFHQIALLGLLSISRCDPHYYNFRKLCASAPSRHTQSGGWSLGWY